MSIQQNPGNSNSDNLNSLANSNQVPFPLDLTPQFSHFNSVNSNSDNSKSSLTQTEFRFLKSEFTPITRILVHVTHHGCPPISFCCRVTLQQFDFNQCNCDRPFTYLTVIAGSCESYQMKQCYSAERHEKYTCISDEISFICTVLYTEVLKNQ